MEGNSSYGTTWADQWDHSSSNHGGTETEKSGGATAKYGKKIGEGLGKTKAVASAGLKKVKGGTSLGLQWIKVKYHKTTQKR